MRPSTLLCTSALALILFVAGSGQAPPDQRYALSVQDGPYLIHVASFRGDEANSYANKLTEELRTRYKLLAFSYELEDLAAKQEREELRQKQIQMLGGTDQIYGTNERQKLRTVRVLKEYAVFVGNFKDFDQARASLQKIRSLEPPQSIPQYGLHIYRKPVERTNAEVDTSEFNMLRVPTKSVEGQKLGEVKGNAFQQAFVCKNPMLRGEQPVTVASQPQTQVDPAWFEMNAHEKYSIFTCPKPWTLVVAVFHLPVEVQSSLRKDVFKDRPAAVAARGPDTPAEQGRMLAELLRDGGRGYDAYIFHTQGSTIVTVGGFDSRTDEKMKQAWEILCEFAAKQTTGPFSLMLKVPKPMQIPGRQ